MYLGHICPGSGSEGLLILYVWPIKDSRTFGLDPRIILDIPKIRFFLEYTYKMSVKDFKILFTARQDYGIGSADFLYQFRSQRDSPNVHKL